MESRYCPSDGEPGQSLSLWVPVTYEEDFLPFRSFIATWCLSSFQSRPHHLLWTLSPTLFLSPASIWKLWGKTHVLDILRPELTRFSPIKLAFPSRQPTQSPYALFLFSASSLQLTETTDAQGKGEVMSLPQAGLRGTNFSSIQSSSDTVGLSY